MKGSLKKNGLKVRIDESMIYDSMRNMESIGGMAFEASVDGSKGTALSYILTRIGGIGSE